MEVCKTLRTTLAQQLTDAQKHLEESNAQLESVNEKITAAQLKISALAAEKDSTEESMHQLEELAQTASGDREKRQAQLEHYRQENEDLARQLTEKQQQADELQRQIDEQRLALQHSGEKRLQIEGKKTQTEKEAQGKNKDLMNMERECARLEQKKATTAMEEKQILDKLWDNYELTNTTAQEAKVEIESLSAAQKRIGELRRKMNALGHPNIGAIEEFQRVNARRRNCAMLP